MIHQYKLGGYNIVLDVCSGSVHVVDDVAYDMISLFEGSDREAVISAAAEKYASREGITRRDLEECYDQVAALRDSGIPFDADLLVETDGCFEMPETYAGASRLIESGADFTAVFTLSDTTAMAAMKALEDHGRRVPEDCSVIAIDGISVSEYVNPTLPTMVQPVEEMGRESVHILADMIEQRCSSRHLRLEARLRPGGSVRQI